MKFNEKLKTARRDAGMKQADLGKAIGVSSRTIIKYENGDCYPRNRERYIKLAEALNVDVNYLLTEDEEFVLTASESYGRKGRIQAQSILEQTSALFAGGELDDDDKFAFIHQLQELYLESKETAKKFAPIKFRKDK